jgi:hemoglobin-like flavoprotein
MGMGDRSLVVWSLERVAELHGDPTPQVYARLFALNPEVEALFMLDSQRGVKGAMLGHVIDTLLDLAGPRHYGANMIYAEMTNHSGIGVPPAQFVTFFDVVKEEFRALIGAEWTAEVEAAWDDTLEDVKRVVAKVEAAQAA